MAEALEPGDVLLNGATPAGALGQGLVIRDGSLVEDEVGMTTHPIHEQAARVALLVSRELGPPERPAGFQAASSIVRSLEYAVEQLGNTIVR